MYHTSQVSYGNAHRLSLCDLVEFTVLETLQGTTSARENGFKP